MGTENFDAGPKLTSKIDFDVRLSKRIGVALLRNACLVFFRISGRN